MDVYFVNLYNYVHNLYPGISLLTPPMAQHLYAEEISFSACDPLVVTTDENGSYAGYDLMFFTYTSMNDGYSWHNYWRRNKETWDDNFCPSKSSLPSSDHLFQYFQPWLQDQIAESGKPAFITEADLLSPCPNQGNLLTNKDANSGATADSLWQFIAQERGAAYVVAWLLTESPHFGATCAGFPTEIAWHEAYREDGYEHPWFPLWWLRQE